MLTYAYLGRVQVVQRFPTMAGAYAAVGLRINVVGLGFSDVPSLQTLRNGKEVLMISAQIVGLSSSPVPAVIVTLIGPNGQGVYQWSVQPTVCDLMVGECSTFDTQLTLLPGKASRVRFSFAGGPVSRAISASQATQGALLVWPLLPISLRPTVPLLTLALNLSTVSLSPANASPELH
ncbi:MAG: hypothetical protein MO846_06030 [Candidatus Devosia symbiotica]|nr:hypothetical protein [Candidatus Devosia symbiotica]